MGGINDSYLSLYCQALGMLITQFLLAEVEKVQKASKENEIALMLQFVVPTWP